VQSATRKAESLAEEPAERRATPEPKKAKLSVFLITGDELLWPQVGGALSKELILKQVDSVDELLGSTPAGHPAIVVWDARRQSEASAVLSRLQLHSPRFAVVVLDEASNAQIWANPTALRQVVAHVEVPISGAALAAALETAQEEVHARVALLGESGGVASGKSAGERKIPWVPVALALGVVIAGVTGYFVLQHGGGAVKGTTAAGSAHTPALAPGSTVADSTLAGSAAAATKGSASSDEKVDLLIEKAQQAMLERHYIDPADGSALSLYRGALLLDPQNGEARQGLERLAEILFTRVQSDLDERKFDVALQALETARSIDPDDSRLSALDARIASVRAEFGPAQIVAAINAQSFDRAAQLIDDAARSKALNPLKITQLRDELRHKHQEFDVANFVKLIDTRLQQDKLTEPRNDSAVYYLNQARAAGATSASLQPQTQEINRQLSQTVRAAIEQKRFGDADKLIGELRGYGVPTSTVAGLQHEVGVARGQQAAAALPQYAELAQSRLTQGKLIEPDNDSALFYVNQLRATDPKNVSLSRLSSAVQAQILDQARAALDAAQPQKAAVLLQSAGSLGGAPDLDALNARLTQMKQAGAPMPEVTEAALTRIKPITLDYPEGALRKGTEGWVEMAYVVGSDGKVSNIKVLASDPAGTFESAATRAISRVRYRPAMQNGKPTAVSTKLRIAFRMTQ
jgi:TonB family protein